MKKLISLILLSVFLFPPIFASAQVNVNLLKSKFEEAARTFDSGDYNKAIKLFEETLKIHPKFAYSHNYLGMAYRAKGRDLKEVVKYFEKAVEVDPDFAQGYENLGKTYYSLGEFDKAEEASLRALEIDPKLVSVKISLGWVYLIGMGRAGDAIENFESAIESDDVRPPYAYLGLGIAYYLDGESFKVLELITKLREIKYEKLALELEEMIRNGKKINPNEFGAPLVLKGRQKSTLIKHFPLDLEKKKTASDQGVGGMKVRLRANPQENIAQEKNVLTGSERIRQLQEKENAASSMFGEYYGIKGHSY